MTQTRYSTVAILLHWTIAALLVWTVLLAWQAEDLKGAAKIAVLQLHKPIGITIMLLTLLRIVWRFVKPAPPMGDHLKPWEKTLAKSVYGLFYIFMIAVPLTGWAMVSASALIQQYPIDMFGLFDWPAITPLYELPAELRHTRNEQLEDVHKLLAKVIIYGLVPLHILGALKHQFLDKDNELAKMIPFLAKKDPAA
ncbi:MAG: cytochrome b [Caulobacter sp.]|nr:cytochrome b [Caulobacter sp.]